MLITRSNGRATRTSVSAVTENRVVTERVDRTIRADQNAVADVAINLVLIERDAGDACVSGIAGANTSTAIERNLAIPNEDVRQRGRGCVGENTVRGVAREHATACRHSRARPRVQAIRVSGKPDVV